MITHHFCKGLQFVGGGGWRLTTKDSLDSLADLKLMPLGITVDLKIFNRVRLSEIDADFSLFW